VQFIGVAGVTIFADLFHTLSKKSIHTSPSDFQLKHDPLQLLREQHSMEADAVRKFQLDHQIAEAKKDIEQLLDW